MSVIKKAKALLITIAIMAAILLFNGNLFNLVHNLAELKKLNNRSAALDAEYKELTEEYEKILQGDTSYLQRTARVKYHLAKPGEIEFRIEK